jgi:hypothetical protein
VQIGTVLPVVQITQKTESTTWACIPAVFR